MQDTIRGNVRNFLKVSHGRRLNCVDLLDFESDRPDYRAREKCVVINLFGDPDPGPKSAHSNRVWLEEVAA